MKKIFYFSELQPFDRDYTLRATFTSIEVAYNYIIDYLNYLEIDAKEYLGGEKLKMELIRLNIIRRELPEILKWDLNDERQYHCFYCNGFALDDILLYETNEDLKRENKRSEVELEF